jgi:hypothetical protein
MNPHEMHLCVASIWPSANAEEVYRGKARSVCVTSVFDRGHEHRLTEEDVLATLREVNVMLISYESKVPWYVYIRSWRAGGYGGAHLPVVGN